MDEIIVGSHVVINNHDGLPDEPEYNLSHYRGYEVGSDHVVTEILSEHLVCPYRLGNPGIFVTREEIELARIN